MSETDPAVESPRETPNVPDPAGANDFELPVAGFQGTADQIERQWFERVYRGRGDSMAQLTVRAVVMGSLLGGVLSLTNLYVGLKTGWGFGVAITACILSYAIWTTFYQLGLVGSRMTILENNCMQSTASSAGYSTGGTLISAFAAYMMIHGEPLSIPLTLAWVFFIAVLGVTMAIPMKRQMINIEQLRFPSGIAAAETLVALHSHGAKGMRAARALGIAGVAAAVSKFWAEGLTLFDDKASAYSLTAIVEQLNKKTLGQSWVDRTVLFGWEPMFIAAGVLTGLRVSISMFVGGTLCWVVFVPILQHQGVTNATGYRELILWTVWGGASCMVTSGLLSFALQWRSVLRAFGDLGKMFLPGKRRADELSAIETPGSWFVIGQVVSLAALAILAHESFGMPYWQSALAVLLSFLLSLVACRVTGETDTTPVGPMGKVTQLIFGVIHPASGSANVLRAMDVNLMSANITSGAAGSAADLLVDLKSGYLLGANPRKQFLAQFAGIFVGTLVTVLCFRIMVPSADVLGSSQFPAPAAQAWKAVAVALGEGFATLEPVKKWSILIGGLVGIALPLLSKLFPKYDKWIPSAAGIGLAWTFDWYYSLMFLLGAILGHAIEHKAPKASKEYAFPVASGVIAGDALMGVLVQFCKNAPGMIRQLFG